MYIYMCVYIYIYIYICMHIFTYILTYINGKITLIYGYFWSFSKLSTAQTFALKKVLSS